MLVQINLMPVELRGKSVSEKKKSLKLKVPRYVFYIVIGGLLVISVASFAAITYSKSIQNELVRAKNILREERKRATHSIVLKTELPDIERRVSSLVNRVNGKIYWWELLDQIARSCPSNAVLSSIKLKTGVNTEYPSELIISGFYVDGNSLEITFTGNLKASAKLTKYVDDIYPTDKKTIAEKTLFTVICKFRQPQQEAETVDRKTGTTKK